MHRNRKDGRSNSHVSYTTRYMDLAGWNEHNVEQLSEFEQKTILVFHKQCRSQLSSQLQPLKTYPNSWDQSVRACIHLDTIITTPNCLKATQNCVCMNYPLQSSRFHHASIFNDKQNVSFLTVTICVCLHPQFAASIVGRDNFSSRSRHLCNTQDWNIKISEINPP